MTSSTAPSGYHDKLYILIDQIGRLIEVVTTGFQDFRAELTELKALIQWQAEAAQQQADVAQQQAATVGQQAESVARLTAIAETLIRQRQS